MSIVVGAHLPAGLLELEIFMANSNEFMLFQWNPIEARHIIYASQIAFAVIHGWHLRRKAFSSAATHATATAVTDILSRITNAELSNSRCDCDLFRRNILQRLWNNESIIIAAANECSLKYVFPIY